jgi:hypothetical protein
MTARASLEAMQQRISGKVKGGVIVLDDAKLADGASVTVLVELADVLAPPEIPIELDANGDVIMTPELEADLDAAESEADRGDLIPWEQVRATLWPTR